MKIETKHNTRESHQTTRKKKAERNNNKVGKQLTKWQ